MDQVRVHCRFRGLQRKDTCLADMKNLCGKLQPAATESKCKRRGVHCTWHLPVPPQYGSLASLCPAVDLQQQPGEIPGGSRCPLPPAVLFFMARSIVALWPIKSRQRAVPLQLSSRALDPTPSSPPPVTFRALMVPCDGVSADAAYAADKFKYVHRIFLCIVPYLPLQSCNSEARLARKADPQAGEIPNQ